MSTPPPIVSPHFMNSSSMNNKKMFIIASHKAWINIKENNILEKK
jgi:hypothetical protein